MIVSPSTVSGSWRFFSPLSRVTKVSKVSFCATLFLGTFSVLAGGARAADTSVDPADWAESDVGIPVTDTLTTQRCGSCHTPDAKGNLSRISWTRATPEGWAQTLKRMVKLNGLSITPDEARSVVKYLSTSHGLAPEEAEPVMYFAERRIQDEKIIPNDVLHQTCASCHAFAQPMSSRRSHREWALLQNMHKALYATAQRTYETPAAGSAHEAGAEAETQAQVALAWLTKNAPLHTPEWAAWSPSIRAPNLAGKWFVSAAFDGHGRFVGEMDLAAKAAGSDEFTSTTSLKSLDDGKVVTRKGVGLVYAGYSWRGTSQGEEGDPARPDDIADKMRETMWFAPDQAKSVGRWYWGEYHEFGLDVTLMRETGAPMVGAVWPNALKSGAVGVQMHLYGAALPASVSVGDVDFGSGVTVRKVASISSGEIVATVDVGTAAVAGSRSVVVHGAMLPKAITVYSGIDYIKVSPDTALAHLGGIKYGKGYQQFAATGWSAGPDGKPGNADDFPIRSVPVSWSLAEFPTVTYDDDVHFVGKLDPASGLFTPNVEGPDTQRRFMRNNYGEVWVVATAKDDKDAAGRPLVGRSYLVTTVPAYKRWDQPEVSE
nr:quinohemoprotein amine dehydrogenase subunit alpha [Acetobacter sp. DsW_063]